MNKLPLVLFVLILSQPIVVLGADAAEAAVVGKQTRDALELQRSGRAASETKRPMSGDVAERAYLRYVESFSNPIPETFKDQEEAFVEGSK